MITSYSSTYLKEVVNIANLLDPTALESLVDLLVNVRRNAGRIFFLGVGGSAANCSHAVNDFRKLAEFECYSPCDNVAELSARTNDSGWESTFVEWLKISRLRENDLVFVLSVGGGDEERNISPNLVHALRYAKEIGARIAGIVSGDGGYTARVADHTILIPIVHDSRRTPHAESYQGILLHLLVSHPSICMQSMKWESVQEIPAIRLANGAR